MSSGSRRSCEALADTSSRTSAASTGSPFFELPLEVRCNIYDLMVRLPYRDHLNLLCVHKQVHGEARESFYQRPLYCDSQYDLIKFVERWPESVLQSITDLRMRVEEIRPEIMQEYLAAIASGNPELIHRHPYLMEINQITFALAELPGITHLQLLRPIGLQTSIPSSIVMTHLLNWAAENYPILRSLRLDIEQCHIGCLGSFTELSSLQMTGYSETSPMRTADVLSKLTNLEELMVVGPPRGLQTLQRHGMDADVFLTQKTMKALYEVHRESLRSLTISSTTIPTSAFVEYLSAFLLGTTNMKEVRIMWPDIETAIVDCIPNTVRRLELAVASRDQAQAIIDRLVLMKYRLKCLQCVHFHIINPVHETSADDKGAGSNRLAFGLPIRRLDTAIESPFKISWGIWQPMLPE
ncbi:hypothetical protein A1O7_05468 [Cladophialophora yegresii CBS 114405]|uniref:F-box domain-containing protein n=1 Tax=Cladophialophora yegresii CBS 114405 TaxID=1182544 RepID=W9VZA7_9EURO|nr:uncharacterized protein A1O7_05468 [Cladophialophora yegresii CBS 114405]EXJ58045.1 hypothetical protein A1O7_05468 [Cladophialophora yegresii CBS 114405]